MAVKENSVCNFDKSMIRPLMDASYTSTIGQEKTNKIIQCYKNKIKQYCCYIIQRDLFLKTLSEKFNYFTKNKQNIYIHIWVRLLTLFTVGGAAGGAILWLWLPSVTLFNDRPW